MRVFVESQRFDQWWMRAIMLFVVGTCVLPFIMSDDLTSSDTTALIILIAAVGLTLFCAVFVLFILTLKTKIDDQGVHVHFFPFKRSPRLIPWIEIAQIYTRQYSPIGEYGGWGYRIRLGKAKSTAYNVKGRTGIQIELTNGKKILIGTQKQTEAESVINYYNHKSEAL